MKLHHLAPLAAAVLLAACRPEAATLPARSDEPVGPSADEIAPPPPDTTGRSGHMGGSGN
ncbi:MAG TPA: hypothetical protein VEW03_02260 [Longimicrobiaceae bacterium]|nr:hypothetical protein [Longimicrobiaceae bacterium]